jgi:hypothetical protein
MVVELIGATTTTTREGLQVQAESDVSLQSKDANVYPTKIKVSDDESLAYAKDCTADSACFSWGVELHHCSCLSEYQFVKVILSQALTFFLLKPSSRNRAGQGSSILTFA